MALCPAPSRDDACVILALPPVFIHHLFTSINIVYLKCQGWLVCHYSPSSGKSILPSCMINIPDVNQAVRRSAAMPPVSDMLITVQFTIVPESTVQGHFSWIFYS